MNDLFIINFLVSEERTRHNSYAMRTNNQFQFFVPYFYQFYVNGYDTHISADKAEPNSDQSYGKLKALLAVGLKCVDEEVKLRGVNKKSESNLFDLAAGVR